MGLHDPDCRGHPTGRAGPAPRPGGQRARTPGAGYQSAHLRHRAGYRRADHFGGDPEGRRETLLHSGKGYVFLIIKGNTLGHPKLFIYFLWF